MDEALQVGAETQEDAQTAVPFTILTGFLGGGKTTVLNHILRNANGLKIAVLVNDFGAVDIDGQLVAEGLAAGVESARDIITLSDGCVCCSINSNLKDAIERVTKQAGGPPDHFLLETSGVSDPAGIIDSLAAPAVRALVWLANVVTVVDCEAYATFCAQDPTAVSQLAHSDTIVLNKTDLLQAPGQLQEIKNDIAARIREAKGALGILHGGVSAPHFVHCEYGKIPVWEVIDTGGLAERALAQAGAPTCSLKPRPERQAWEAESKDAVLADVSNSSLCGADVSNSSLSVADVSNSSLCGDDTCEPAGSHSHTGPGEAGMACSRNGGEKSKGLGKDGSRGAGQRAGCGVTNESGGARAGGGAQQPMRGSHLAGPGLATAYFQSEEPISLARFQRFVVKELPAGLLRAKGFLQFAEDPDRRFIFQLSGHRRFDFEEVPWKEDQKRISQVVFIGCNMKTEQLEHIDLSSTLTDDKHMEGTCPAWVIREALARDHRFVQHVDADNIIHFGIRHHPWHGATSDQLNKALASTINRRGNLFVTTSEVVNNGESTTMIRYHAKDGLSKKASYEIQESASELLGSMFLATFCCGASPYM